MGDHFLQRTGDDGVVVGAGVEPAAAVKFDQVHGGLGAPGVGGVLLRGIGAGGPGFFDGVDHLPGGFGFVAADEEGLVAEEGVVQEPFVGFGGFGR